MNLIYHKAGISNIDTLVNVRIQVLRAANLLNENTNMKNIEKELYSYYKKYLKDDSHIAYLVFNNNEFVGAGDIIFYKVMPTYHNPSGKRAYIMNMYTVPEYRHRGIAYKTLDLLVNEAIQRGITYITLEATEMGKPLYKKYGFVQLQNEMQFEC